MGEGEADDQYHNAQQRKADFRSGPGMPRRLCAGTLIWIG